MIFTANVTEVFRRESQSATTGFDNASIRVTRPATNYYPLPKQKSPTSFSEIGLIYNSRKYYL